MKNLWILISFFVITNILYSQECKSYALHWDINENKEFMTHIDPITGDVIILDSIPGIETIQHGFSAINADQGFYYFYGLDADYIGKLYSMNLQNGSIENAVIFPPSNINGNIIEMHYHPFTGLMYGLHWDMIEEMEYFISIDPQNGQVVKIDSLPDVHLIQLDFSALNHLNDRFYFMGIDYNNDSRIYTLDINNGEIIDNPIFPANDINGGVNELEVDPLRGNLYSLHYDPFEMMEYFVRINPESALVTKMASLPSVQFIQSGFSAINTLDGQYYFHGIDENNFGLLYSVDIYSGNIIYSVEIDENLNGGLKELQFPNISPVIPNMSQTSICADDSSLIIAPAGFAQYEWSNGSTENHIFVTDSSQYSLLLSKDYGCQIEVEPMPLQLYDCDEYIDSVLVMHDSCLFDPEQISMSYINNIEITDNEVVLEWNFVSIHSDTTSIIANYEFSENGLYQLFIGFNCDLKSEVYYFSNMVEVDHLNPTNLEKSQSISQFKVYPNPGESFINIDIGTLNGTSTLQISNALNQVVYEKSMGANEIHQLDMRQWPKGIYFLTLISQDYFESIKWIKH